MEIYVVLNKTISGKEKKKNKLKNHRILILTNFVVIGNFVMFFSILIVPSSINYVSFDREYCF